MPSIEELLALAEERAAMEVETWIPEKPGDKIAGQVLEVGSITTKYGNYFTTTLAVAGSYTENGEIKAGQGLYVRVAWMGAVLVAQFQRMQPRPDDICAFHYQKNLVPQNGMNEYALIVAAVIDPNTGRAKVPANLSIVVPTESQIVNADVRTGEIARTSVEPFPEDDASVAADIAEGEKIKAERKTAPKG